MVCSFNLFCFFSHPILQKASLWKHACNEDVKQSQDLGGMGELASQCPCLCVTVGWIAFPRNSLIGGFWGRRIKNQRTFSYAQKKKIKNPCNFIGSCCWGKCLKKDWIHFSMFLLFAFYSTASSSLGKGKGLAQGSVAETNKQKHKGTVSNILLNSYKSALNLLLPSS